MWAFFLVTPRRKDSELAFFERCVLRRKAATYSD